MSFKKSISVLAIIFALIILLQTGCWNKGSSVNPMAPVISDVGSANVLFTIAMPQPDNISPSIMANVASEAIVTFKLKLVNYGNFSNPFSVIVKKAVAQNGSATIIFQGLPLTTVLGELHLDNGKIGSYTDFHGALDLSVGSNTVELAPVGSLMKQDVVAHAIGSVVSSSTLFLNASHTLALDLSNIVTNLLLNSDQAYEEVISNFNNSNSLPFVDVISPDNNRVYTIGDQVTIVASSTDLDGTIAKVEFFQNEIKIGEKSTPPFSMDWLPQSIGSYTLLIKATDNNNAVKLTRPVNVSVREAPPTFTVTYSGNGNTSGTIPADNNAYETNSTVTVDTNSGSLLKTDYTFAGWNTKADGSGISYDIGTNFIMGSANVVLYAKWLLIPTYTVVYNGNGNASGDVPTDNLTYQQSATVPVKDNTGSLIKIGYTFAGWNTASDGSGISYNSGSTFAMDTANVVLYAKWQPGFFSGDGSATDPFTISTPEHLNNVRFFVDQHFLLVNDIDLSSYLGPNGLGYDFGAGWLPIDGFSGGFDGGGFKISNLLIKRPTESYAGFFKLVSLGAQVKNLILENLNINSLSNGGLVGSNYGEIINCRTSGSVSANFTTTGFVSGILPTFESCLAGGFVLRNYGIITSCLSNCSVKGWYIGGFAATNSSNGIIVNSSQLTGSVVGVMSAGGFVLDNLGTIKACYSTGNTSANNKVNNSGSSCGGFVSQNTGPISNCYARGSVGGVVSSSCGGFVYRNDSSITNCFSTGGVTATSKGGFACQLDTNGSITNSFWDTESSGVPVGFSAGGSGLVTSAMKEELSYTDWDFANIWLFDSIINDGYPTLR